jgi:hypothetical protein
LRKICLLPTFLRRRSDFFSSLLEHEAAGSSWSPACGSGQDSRPSTGWGLTHGRNADSNIHVVSRVPAATAGRLSRTQSPRRAADRTLDRHRQEQVARPDRRDPRAPPQGPKASLSPSTESSAGGALRQALEQGPQLALGPKKTLAGGGGERRRYGAPRAKSGSGCRR